MHVDDVRNNFSIARILATLGCAEFKPVVGDQQNRKTHFECPFHQTKWMPLSEWDEYGAEYMKHPLVVYDDLTWTCRECHRKGDVNALHNLIYKTPNKSVSFFELLRGREELLPELFSAASCERLEERLTGETKLLETGTLFIEPPSAEGRGVSWTDLNNSLNNLDRFVPLADFARQKRWLVETLEGFYPLGVGMEIAPGVTTLQFPKLLLTDKSRKFFQKPDGIIDKKFRVPPEAALAIGGGQREIKWVAPKSYLQSIPWEFDAHQDADILFIVVGPGSGLRLHNEMNADRGLHENVGLRSHILGLDSYWNLSPTSMVRDLVDSQLTSLYNGYKKINLILDDQITPMQEEMLSSSLKLLKAFSDDGTKVKVVRLGVSGVGEFFERGGDITAFAEICRYALEI
jgi:hypothetical protein